ncbi:MAG: hypothetical protein RL475_943 [Actinomycetota bacterium]
MNTPLRTSTPLFGSSKIARAVITGLLTLAMGMSGLSSASATPPDLVSVTALLAGVSQTVAKADPLLAQVGQSVGAITATLTEESTLVGSGEITISGGVIPAGTTYGTFVVSGRTLTITPGVSNDQLALVGTFTFSIAAGQIEDGAGNPNAATTFTMVVSPDGPTVSFSPLHNATDIAVNRVLTITFDEAVRNIDNSEITDLNVASLITFRKTDASGAVVPVTVTINTGKTVITITPVANLDNSQIYYLGIEATVENAAGNGITSTHARFTTIAATPAPAPAPAPAPVAVSSPSYSAAEVAAIRAANAAALKADEEKAAATKALADAKAAAEVAAKIAADKVAAEAAAVVKAAADKVEAEARAAAEVIVAAQEAKVAAAVVKAAAASVKAVVSKSGTKITLDLPDKYLGKIVTIYVGTTVKGKTTYKKLDYFALDTLDGRASITSKVKLVKGQIIRVNVGSTVVKSVKI